MKKLYILIFLVPQLLYGQYQSKEFILSNERNIASQSTGAIFTKDTIVSLDINQPISGFFISGLTGFENAHDSYTRITVKDKKDKEYLVYENYPLLADGNSSRFSKVAIESMLLDDVIPTYMKIEVHNASIQIDSIFYSLGQNLEERYPIKANIIRKEQSQYIAEKLNSHLKERKIPWYAGCTSIALKNFEERKKMFGNRVPCLYGFDFYKGGLYVMNPMQDEPQDVVQEPTRTDLFVKDYDWRNRHGKNWIASVKEQSGNTCWAFATVATTESNFNIYFNQVFPDSINNLSEQELVSCLDNDGQSIFTRYLSGGYTMYALDYIIRNGIVKEECFPFMGLVSCESKCNNPTEQVSFSSFRNLYRNNRFDDSIYMYNDSIADILRMSIIKSPVVVDYFKGSGHSISCVGFHKIQMGDTICSSIITSYYFVVDSTTSHFVNQISWIIKNSWGDDWGENGFARVSFSYVYLRLYEIIPPFTSQIYLDNNRCMLDEDMDGFYTWGSGSKPLNCPSWIPDEPDGDDSNYQYGPMDSYGNLEDLELRGLQTTHITMDSTFTSRAFFYTNTCVCSMSKLTIKSTITLYGSTKIIVEPSGEFIIDGGVLENADIELSSGSKLVLKNGGTIIMRDGKDFYAPIGTTVVIEDGLIK